MMFTLPQIRGGTDGRRNILRFGPTGSGSILLQSVINAGSVSQSCHPRMPHWCGSGPAAPVVLNRTLIMTVGFTNQPKCVVLASAPPA